MFDYQIDIEQVENTDQEPKVAFVVKRNDEEVLRNEARLFSEDDMIAASNQIAQAGNATNADIDQIIAGLIEPIRLRWLRAREEENQAMPPDANPPQKPNENLFRYAAVFPGADENNSQGEPCIRDLTTNRALSNFVLIFTEEIEMKNDIEPWQEFRGTLTISNRSLPFQINASATARSIIIKIPQQNKNLEAGRRCMNECENYSGVTADFIRWLIQGDRAAIFVERFETLQTRYFSDVAGQQNDIRIATNLAQLGAAFEMFAEYFGDVWPEWKEASRNFVDAELITLRDQMLGEAKEQQSSEIFLKQLNELITYNHVQIDGYSGANTENKPKIGRVLGRNRQGFIRSERAASGAQFFEISMSLALAEVNQTLRKQGRPELRATESNLLAQLREDWKLFDKDGQPIARNAKKANPRTRLNGVQIRVFIISRQELFG